MKMGCITSGTWLSKEMIALDTAHNNHMKGIRVKKKFFANGAPPRYQINICVKCLYAIAMGGG
jgi:hypothetical protein